ncbi:DUF555 domain-containing protein [Natrinema sp. SYSU A 869]|uniref:DUF555 domain-containing protein n=1 Tax=Natrinema sp. SYSU A 869 TaxID=2871694 RepID=UPI001CA40F6B|nr:DUF555 domain-containing protein [Natrinema sp. SYSU A 869]
MDYRVAVDAAVPVYNIDTADEAIRIAIAKTGNMLNPDLSYVEITPGSRVSAGEELPPVFVAADQALVALELELDVFNVTTEHHAERITLKEIGQHVDNTPLKVLTADIIEEEEGTETDPEGDNGGETAAVEDDVL